MSDDPVLRPATPGDLELLLGMNDEYRTAEGHPVDRVTARAGIEPLLGDTTHGAIHLVLDDEGTPVGYAVLAWSWSVEIGGAEAVLDELFVARRGEGFGGRAIEALVEICRHQGMRRMFMETERVNERARALYRRHGFVEDDSIWMSRTL